MKQRFKVAIVGAGIAGLSAAYDLQKDGRFEVSVLESAAGLGGKIQTVSEDGFLIELGPDSIFTAKPWALDLMVELGMEDEVVGPLSSEFAILTKGKLHSVPRALAGLMPAASGALEKVAFLGAAAKRRAIRESEVDAGNGNDESIASFFRRRFGKRFSELVAEPMLAGTHAGDPEKLSMAALYPSYLGMEQEHGSIAKASAERAQTSARKAGFVSLRGGMGSFVDRLIASLSVVRVLPSTTVTSIQRMGAGLIVQSNLGEFDADHVLLATPAHAAFEMLRAIAPEAGARLQEIRFVSTAIATLAYERSAFSGQMTGNGFLVPTDEPSAITGCTWSSNKWPGRAADELLLLRAFMGRDGGLDVDKLSTAQLGSMAEKELGDLLEPDRKPIKARVDRWTKAMPQYELGHLERMAAIELSLAGLPITLIGSSYRGNSIPDCVRQGREAASKLISELAG